MQGPECARNSGAARGVPASSAPDMIRIAISQAAFDDQNPTLDTLPDRTPEGRNRPEAEGRCY
jgi:hypothetical protein